MWTPNKACWYRLVFFVVTSGCADILGFEEGKPYPPDAGGAADSSLVEVADGGADAPQVSPETAPPDSSGCDTSADPAQTPCLVDEGYGLFVSPNGNDQSGMGTRSSPFKTIAKGIEQGVTKGKSVYVCAAATYDEQLVLDVGASGTKLYGGFDCGTWNHLSNTRTVVRPSTPGVVLTAAKVSSVFVEDFEFDAHDGMAPGDSSVAVLVASSDRVRLVRTKLVAGRGIEGARGTSLPASASLDGRAPQASPERLAFRSTNSHRGP